MDGHMESLTRSQIRKYTTLALMTALVSFTMTSLRWHPPRGCAITESKSTFAQNYILYWPASVRNGLCDVKPLSIRVRDERTGPVKAWLHLPRNHHRKQSEEIVRTAVILVSGYDGGVTGPLSIYLGLADKIASLDEGIPVMRLDYRYPAINRYCTADIEAAMGHLEKRYGISRFILVGWSFGGAPVFTVGGKDERVVACAMMASQLAETEGIKTLAPRPLLLMHGTSDRTLRYSGSQELYASYGDRGERRLELFENDDHYLRRSRRMVEKLLCKFVVDNAGVRG